MNRRIKNYDKARLVMKALTEGKPVLKTEFKGLYEQLVGGKGIGSLWASDQLYRQKSNVVSNYKQVIAMFAALKELIGQSPESIVEAGMARTQKIRGLGPNVLTEAMHTWNPQRYPVLNNNTITALKELGVRFPNPRSFRAQTFKSYSQTIGLLAEQCKFKSLTHMDKFLNFIYWQQKE